MTTITLSGKTKTTGPNFSTVGALFGIPGTFFGAFADKLFSRKKVTLPVQIDTESGKVQVYDQEGNFARPNTAGYGIQVQLQRAFDTGQSVQVPKRYRRALQETLNARSLRESEMSFLPAPEPAPPFQQYGDNMITVPPGGFAAFAQMTPASKAAQRWAGAGGIRRAGKKKRSKKASGAKRTRKRASGAKRGAKRLVKGSAAAKRFMAALRRKRK